MTQESIKTILRKYQQSFSDKIYREENSDHDILMDVFNITPELKQENKQYWGRELGMCWQLLITTIAKIYCVNFKESFKNGKDEFFDLFIDNDAIDTKYRIGSGDSGTLKKIKKYGKEIRLLGYKPVLLILREDNLPAAITACTREWELYQGKDCLQYIKNKTGFDVEKNLLEMNDEFHITR